MTPGQFWTGFALGVTLGALVYPVGLILGHWLFERSVLYPHIPTKENS